MKKKRARERGALAYLAGKKENPYKRRNTSSRDYVEWWEGYWEQRIRSRLGKIFEKHGIEWP